jgi:hypothetical protein
LNAAMPRLAGREPATYQAIPTPLEASGMSRPQPAIAVGPAHITLAVPTRRVNCR